jgi:hypothetical protein
MTVITVEIVLNGELHPIVVSQIREVWWLQEKDL